MRDMKINEHILRLSGMASVETPPQLGHGYQVHLECVIDDPTFKNREDGTYDAIYKVKPVRAEIIDDKGVAIKTKDFRSESQKTRSLIKFEWEQRNVNMDFEKYYELICKKIRDNIAAFADEIIN